MIPPTIPGSEEKVLEALRSQVREVVRTAAAPGIRSDLEGLLERPGYALHPEGACRAGVLALAVHGAVIREAAGRAALLAAAAAELQMEAAYVFDEVGDAPAHERRSDDLALAIALLTAGTAAAVEASKGLPAGSAALARFCAAYGEACAGQFLDARLQGRAGATLEEALRMTCMKSGGLGSFVTGFAARVAGVDEDGATLFERFGLHTFTLAQLVDDLRDACSPGQDSDLAQGKATLPVVFYRARVDSFAPAGGILSPETCKTYESSGAPLYGAILAQTYLTRAEEDLSRLSRHGYAVKGLRRFLESVESGAGETLSAALGAMVAS